MAHPAITTTIPQITIIRNKKFQCEECMHRYSSKASLNTHRSKMHSIIKPPFKCDFCEYSSKSNLILVNHVIKSHSKVHDYQIIKYTNTKKISKQLDLLINNGKFSFKKTSGPKDLTKGETSYYVCSQIKTGVKCDCFIKTMAKNNKTKVIYQNNHKHKANLFAIRLQKHLKNQLSKQISAGNSIDDLHNTLTSNFNFSNLTKYQTITKNYLRYIRSTNPKTDRFHENDFQNTIAYLKFLKTKSLITFYIYKEKDKEIIGHQGIKNNFIMAFQTSNQHISMLNEESKHLMVDSTHSTNLYGFTLTTYSVLTRTQRFLPILSIISDSDSETVNSYVLECFKRKDLLPQNIDIIMSDMAHTYKNSWTKIVSPRVSWLYCMWHFKNSVIKNIYRKIKNNEIQMLIKEKFKKLCIITEETIFKRKYLNFLIFIKNNSISFYDYFHKQYNHCQERWALCHRKNSELNTNMFLESFHNQLKGCYLKRKSHHRLDFLLQSLIKYDCKRSLYYYLSTKSTNQEYQGFRSKTASKKHALGQALLDKRFRGKGTRVYYKKYTIGIGNCLKCLPNCIPLCKKCGVCKDRYTCTCLSYVLRKEMCKHIHKVHQLYFINQTSCKLSTRYVMNDNTNLINKEATFITSEYALTSITEKSPDCEPNILGKNQNKGSKSIVATTSGCVSENTSNSDKHDINETKCLDIFNFTPRKSDTTHIEVLDSFIEDSLYYSTEMRQQGIGEDNRCTTTQRNNSEQLNRISRSIKKLENKVSNADSVYYLNKVETLIAFIAEIDECQNELDLPVHDINSDMLTKPLSQRKNRKIRKKKH